MNKMILFYCDTMMTNELFRKELGALLFWIATLLYLRGFPAMKLPPTPSEYIELIVELLLECQNSSQSNDGRKTTKSVKIAPQNYRFRLAIPIPKLQNPPDKDTPFDVHRRNRLIVGLLIMMLGFRAHFQSSKRTASTKERNYGSRNFKFRN